MTLGESPVNTSGLRTLALTRLRAQLREFGFYDRAARRLPASQRGVLVDGVEAGGPAGLAHLQGGDVIIRLGDRAVVDLAGLAAALDAALAKGNGSVIPVQVIRGQEIRLLYLERYWLTEKPRIAPRCCSPRCCSPSPCRPRPRPRPTSSRITARSTRTW